MKKVNVLGTEYEIIKAKYDDQEVFARKCINGFCDEYLKKIVVCDPATCAGWENEDAATVAIALAETVRHEIVHAFLTESGLVVGWAKNEEMIDWFTLQGPKIFAAWQAAGAVPQSTADRETR